MNSCNKLMSELQVQDTFYQPGKFWREASKDMLEELSQHGISSFRRLKTSQNFFAPTYGVPGNALTEAQVEQLKQTIEEQSSSKQRDYIAEFLSGYSAALSDYRTLLASEYRSELKSESEINLLKFSESNVGQPTEQFEFEGNQYSRSALNYLLGLSFLRKYTELSEIKTVMEIGGGFGTLGEIVHQVMPKTKYI
ncbi:MAG TPA: putative sugar O-methyltransferase, partial [Gammaproteobacteria bacterium]|nr:putative sugar O-methyltransferase [Gammaproteobacteria bacterium]